MILHIFANGSLISPVDLVNKRALWQFWLPSQGLLNARTKRNGHTFKEADSLFAEGAFRRGTRAQRPWYDFNPDEILTCWDEARNPPKGGVPIGTERDEL
ncbi:hypothetical protein CYMTET_5296 [Cymbomonas tetramitiformis]|uniref:Uncharacterized protein n=1 Tax=Cymbomonas tetramitiformis TaxID=36881 RepID=A0AAE0LJ79_9CHLO|nr:hypothetical protein CYMTET_5296 [Cymbomonas tetramitiformis]